ncbi:MAG: hypothetical protein ABS76_37965 [Pelagibacterium sp. SCN 64-44]|nr:MAG: hypothetical protein ABS76_37965 [Pelagibacterium sp. SCN 64-44]
MITQASRWEYEPGQSLTLYKGGNTVLAYRFGASTPKPYFHPIHTPGGALLTGYQPSDHVWHRGLWFAWKYINGVNYWEEAIGPDGTLVSDGRTLPTGEARFAVDADGSAELSHALGYVAPDGAVVMREARRIVVLAEAGPELMIDVFHDFTVGDADVALEATPANDQTPWGGYAGLGIRASRELTDCRALNDAGQADGDANGASAVWVGLSGVADGGPERNRRAGLALIDHPGNPRHPSPSYVYYDKSAFGYISPSLLRHQSMSLKAGETLRLAYRAVAHDGPTDPARLSQLAADFGSTKPFSV